MSLRSRRVLPLAASGTWACAEGDAVAATFGFAELSENAVANAWSSDVGKFTPSSSSSSSTTTTSFASFFFVLVLFLLFSLGLVFVMPGPYLLLSNAFCRICISSFEPELSSERAFPLPDDRLRGRCFTSA